MGLVEELRNPRVSIPIIALFLLGLTIAIHIRSQIVPSEDVSFYQTLSLAGFTGFLSAGVALWIQSRISRESQDYRFSLEIETRNFVEIYGPLYEGLLTVTTELANCSQPHFDAWSALKRTKYGPFLEKPLDANLDWLEQECQSLRNQWHAAVETLKDPVEMLCAQAPFSDTTDPTSAKEILEALTYCPQYIFLESWFIPPQGIVDKIRTAIGKLRPLSDEETMRCVTLLTDVLHSHRSVRDYAKRSQLLAGFTYQLREYLERRMTSPFHLSEMRSA